MKKKVMVVLLIVTLLVTSFLAFKMRLIKVAGLNETHIGGAIMKEPSREALEDVYAIKNEKLSGYGNFNRTVTVYGLTLIIHKDISDDFVEKITNAVVDIFPKTGDMDVKKQEEVLQAMYRYKAALPVVKSEKDVEAVQEKLMRDYSLCDIIMKVDENQVNEVVEHLLHAISDVGLHYVYNKEWGVSGGSEIKSLMDQAVKENYYRIDDYKGFPKEILERVLIQEYVYWAISSLWNLQEPYGVGDSEWQLNTYSKLAKAQPDLLDLYNRTIPAIMRPPSEEVLKKFQ